MMLKYLNEQLSSIINYELGQWNGKIAFPFWVGEYQEIYYSYEQEYKEYAFTLTGTNRGTWSQLEEDKNKIQKLFANNTAVLEDGSSVAVFYETAYMIPSEDAEIRRMQIQLNVKEWRTNNGE